MYGAGSGILLLYNWVSSLKREQVSEGKRILSTVGCITMYKYVSTHAWQAYREERQKVRGLERQTHFYEQIILNFRDHSPDSTVTVVDTGEKMS